MLEKGDLYQDLKILHSDHLGIKKSKALWEPEKGDTANETLLQLLRGSG